MTEDVWVRFTGQPWAGHFLPSDCRRYQQFMMTHTGIDLEVAIRPVRQKRTLPQNAKLHVLAHLIAAHTGESVDRIKRLAVVNGLGIEGGTEKDVILGQTVTIVRRTSDLTKDEASPVLEWLIERANELSIPEPNWDDVEVMP